MSFTRGASLSTATGWAILLIEPAFMQQQVNIMFRVEVTSSTVLNLLATLQKLKSLLSNVLWGKLVLVGLFDRTDLFSTAQFKITKLRNQIAALQKRIVKKSSSSSDSQGPNH